MFAKIKIENGLRNAIHQFDLCKIYSKSHTVFDVKQLQERLHSIIDKQKCFRKALKFP